MVPRSRPKRTAASVTPAGATPTPVGNWTDVGDVVAIEWQDQPHGA